MWRRGICFSTAVFACVAALAQTLDRNLSFDVASVKRAPLGDGLGMTHVRGGLGSADPGLVTYSNITLMNLLGRAFPESYRTAGPDWLDSERYDVIVKVPPGTTGDRSESSQIGAGGFGTIAGNGTEVRGKCCCTLPVQGPRSPNRRAHE